MIKKIDIPVSGRPFKNNAAYCVGTGRMGLALQKEYIDHLKIVQEAVHFRYIRGHGLFCDDMCIYREHEMDGETSTFYYFTYLDRVMDSYLENGIRPFLELGFMQILCRRGATWANPEALTVNNLRYCWLLLNLSRLMQSCLNKTELMKWN